MIPQPTPWNFPALKAMGFGLVGGRGEWIPYGTTHDTVYFPTSFPGEVVTFSHGTSVETVKIAFANGTNDPLPHPTTYMTYSIVRKTSVPLLPQTLVPMGEGWVGFFDSPNFVVICHNFESQNSSALLNSPGPRLLCYKGSPSLQRTGSALQPLSTPELFLSVSLLFLKQWLLSRPGRAAPLLWICRFLFHRLLR